MSDIQPGDVVVCVDDLHEDPHPAIKRGHMYRVRIVNVVPSGYLDSGAVGLEFLGIESCYPFGFAAERFRKIRPADEQFVQQIRATKPVLEGA